MTLDHDSSFDLASYISLVESFVDGQISEQTFIDKGLALDADPETLETMIANLKQMDGIHD